MSPLWFVDLSELSVKIQYERAYNLPVIDVENVQQKIEKAPMLLMVGSLVSNSVGR